MLNSCVYTDPKDISQNNDIMIHKISLILLLPLPVCYLNIVTAFQQTVYNKCTIMNFCLM